MKLSSLQIGRAGELLVQYKLLCFGIESAPLSTDNGVDLVAFSPWQEKAYSIQVKTNLKPKPGGGKGRLALNWHLRESSPADLVALVDLSAERIWLFTHQEFTKAAQQNNLGALHFYMYIDQEAKVRGRSRVLDFENHLLEAQLKPIFSLPS